MIVNDLTIAAT